MIKKIVKIVLLLASLVFLALLVNEVIRTNMYGNRLRKASTYKQYKRLIGRLSDIYVPQKDESGFVDWQYVLYLDGTKLYSKRRGYSASVIKDKINYVIDVQLFDKALMEGESSLHDYEIEIYQIEDLYRGKDVCHTIYEECEDGELRSYRDECQFDDGGYRYRIEAWFHEKDIYGTENFEDIEKAKETAYNWTEAETKKIIDRIAGAE